MMIKYSGYATISSKSTPTIYNGKFDNFAFMLTSFTGKVWSRNTHS